MNEQTLMVLAACTSLAAVFLTWNKVWGIAKKSIGADISIEQDKRCNKRIVDLTSDLKDIIAPMGEDVTLIRGIVETLKLDHETLKGDIKTIDATMVSMSGHLDAVDKKASRAEQAANSNSVKIAGLGNGQ